MTPENKHRALTVLDQAISSLTNFAPGIYAAHVLTPAQFGVFGLVQFGYIMALGVLRSAFTEVAMVTSSSKVPTRAHLGSVDAVAIGSSVIGLATAMSLGIAVGAVPTVVLVLLTAGFAVALTQDAVRLVAISVGRGGVALVSDASWLAATIALLVLLGGVTTTPWTVATIWFLAALPGLLVGAFGVGWSPRAGRGLEFMRAERTMSAALLGEWGVRTGGNQAVAYGIGIAQGIVTVGSIRAAQILLGPVNIGFAGVQYALTRSAVAARETSLVRMRRLLLRLSLVLGIGSVLLGLVLVLVPTRWLALVLGEQVDDVKLYLMPLTVTVAAAGFATGSALGLRVLRAGSRLFTTRVASAAASVGAALVVYVVTQSALWGLWAQAVATLLSVALWRRAFLASYRKEMAASSS